MKQSFAERCYSLLRRVPRGKVTTYKAIAEFFDCKAYRAVGQAMHRNPHAPKVPCHRVIASYGGLGGFASGVKRKIAMLRREGVKIKSGKIDLARYEFRFRPSTESA